MIDSQQRSLGTEVEEFWEAVNPEQAIPVSAAFNKFQGNSASAIRITEFMNCTRALNLVKLANKDGDMIYSKIVAPVHNDGIQQ